MKRALLVFFLLGLLLPAGGTAQAGGSFVDDSGRTIRFDRPFQRIISLYGAHTENLFALGLDREIIGVSASEDYPPEALARPAFHHREDPEKFIAARPDLVLIRPMIYNGYRRLVLRLEETGVTVVSLQPETVGEMFEYWRRLGALTGRESQAEEMIAEFNERLGEVTEALAGVPPESRPRVYFEAMHDRMKTFSPTAMAVFALESAGGVNVASDAAGRRGTNIAEYGKERILARAGKIDVYLAQVGPMNQVTVETILGESGFGAIKAVREGRVFLVDERLVSRPTPRLILGVRVIAGILYPGRFP
ncbi:MAG: ABC transporter substrate-binding protein [Thermodesulfobacteriota bacterium]